MVVRSSSGQVYKIYAWCTGTTYLYHAMAVQLANLQCVYMLCTRRLFASHLYHLTSMYQRQITRCTARRTNILLQEKIYHKRCTFDVTKDVQDVRFI